MLKDNNKTYMGLSIRPITDYKGETIIISSINYADDMEKELIKLGITDYLRWKI